MEFLFWVAVLLAVITLLGHGIWVAIAALIRVLNGQPRTNAKCPVCQTSLGFDPHSCDACDWSSHAAGAGGPVRIALRMLRRAKDRELVDEDTLRAVGDAFIQAAQAPVAAKLGKVSRDSPRSSGVRDVPATSGVATPPSPAAEEEVPLADQTSPTELVFTSAERIVPDVAERARRFASQQTGPLAGTAEQPSREITKAARKPWSELLSAFMQEKNIRWGEVVGGLLIVSSSIALVVSFWEHIAARPLLKFGIFTGVTAALFGLGLHASHRWKLATTSQGVLIIAMMLVPLNFLAMASFAEAAELTAPTVVGEFVSLGVFLVLGYYASRILTPRFAGTTDLLVVGLGFYSLLVRRFVFGDTTWEALYAVALPMVAAYSLSLWPLRRFSSSDSDDEEAIVTFTSQIWKLLGLASFAFALATAFLVVRTERFGIAVQRLSPLFILAAAPSILTGACLWQTAKARDLRWLLVPSCGVWLAGVVVMLAAIGLSWPLPWLMIATCALGASLCLVLAIWLRLPEIHIGVAALLSISFVLAGLVAGGAIALAEPAGRTVLAELLSVGTGFWYTGYSVLMLIVAILLRIMSRPATSRSYGVAGVVSGLVGAALITAYGFGRHEHAVSVSIAYSVYAVLFYLAAYFSKKAPWQWLSGAAIAGACFQSIYFGLLHEAPVPYRLLITSLTSSTIYMLLACSEQLAQPRKLQVSRIDSQWPFEILALAGCLLTTMAACVAFVLVSPRPVPWAWAGIAALWLVAAWRYANRPMFAVAQAAAVATMGLAIDDYARVCDWYSMRFGVLHPYSLQWHAAGLALFGAVWLGVRWVVGWLSDRSDTSDLSDISSWQRAGWLTRAEPFTVDQLATGVAVAILFALAAYGAAPGTLQELLPADAAAAVGQPVSAPIVADAIDTGAGNVRTVVAAAAFELFEIRHDLIGTPAMWWLLALVVAVTLAGIVERVSIGRLALFVTAAAAAAYLLAMRWEPLVSVASALRWYLAGFFLIGNGLLWTNRVRYAKGIRWQVFGVLCAHTFLPLVAMVISVSVAALQLQPPGPADLQLMFWLLVVGVVGLSVFAGERRATRANWLSKDSAPRRRTITVSTTILACMPLLAITLYLVGTSLALHPVTGPDPGSFFARIGLAASYSVPILLVAVGLTGTAIAWRSAAIALWAGVVLNVGGTAAYLLNLGAAGFDVENWLQLAEVNAIISALFALGWVVLRRRSDGLRTQHGLQTQLNVACGFFSVAVVGVLSVLWWNPGPVMLEQAAAPWGWLSTVSVVAACYAAARVMRNVPLESHLPGLAIAISALVGCHLQSRLTGKWDVSYAVMALVAITGAVVAARMIQLRFGLIHDLRDARSRTAEHHERLALTARLRWWISVVVWILTLFGLRFLDDASVRPWPTAMCLLVAATLAGASGWIEMRARSLWWSAILVNVAFTIIWLLKRQVWQAYPSAVAIDLFHVNVLAATLPTLGWVLIFRHWQTRPDAVRAPGRAVALHRHLVPLGVLLSVLLAAVWLLFALGGGTAFPSLYLSLATILFLGFACWSCFWDDELDWQSLGLYATGLCGAVALLQAQRLSPEPLTWSAPLVFGAYGLAASYLISRRVEMREALGRLSLLPHSALAPTAATRSRGGLLIAASCLLAGITVALAFFAQFRCADQTLRVAASQSILAQAFALALLTRASAHLGDRTGLGVPISALRFGALGLGVVAVIANGWSYFDPAQPLPYERLTVVAMACSGMAVVYGLGLVKLLPQKSAWIGAARQIMPALIATSAAVVCVVMATEIVSYLRFGTEIPLFAIIGVTLTMGIAMLACMIAALAPGRDPLGLPEKYRVAYIYAAEVALLLIVIHIRISMPWLFSGLVQQIWPLLIMLIAFAGIGLSEWARRYSSAPATEGRDRSRYKVLVGPLGQTGAILPLLPALGYWMLPSNVHYSAVMVVVGLGYGVLAQLRKSFGFSVLAALAANGSFWYLLHDNAFELLSHPQVWLIPPALCVLVAAQLNKQRLRPEQLTTIRYACSTVIYVSSTAEIFITGVAEAPWLPLVLAGLSLAGIVVGIAAQIRAFLWLGLSFLAVSMMTIIWYAAVDLQQTWLWYVTGIVMGVIILAVFAVFEKRRADVLRWADQLKRWEA